MTSMSEAKRDHIRARANVTTDPTPGVMPAWVANKPACRWMWDHDSAWRGHIERQSLSPLHRARLSDMARSAFADELRRRRLAELASVMTRMDGDGLHFPGDEE